MTEVEMVELLATATARGIAMQKVATQFHDLVIKESKDRLKQPRFESINENSIVKPKRKKKPLFPEVKEKSAAETNKQAALSSLRSMGLKLG